MSEKKTNSWIINSILLVGVLLVCLIIFEFALRYVFPSGYFEYQPVDGVHSTYEYTYHTKRNSWGIRDREFTSEDLKKRKILLIGDSMTYGQGVELEDTFPKIVEQNLSDIIPPILVINGGGKGTSTLGQFESVKELMKENNFMAVGFSFFLGNDSDNNLDDFKKAGDIQRVFQKEKGGLSVRMWLFSHSILYNYIYYNVKLLAYRLGLIQSFQGRDLLSKEYSDRGKEGWNVTFDIIDQIKKYFEENRETQLFFVLLPQDFQVDPEKRKKYSLSDDKYDFNKPNRLLANYLDQKEIRYLDTTDAFIRHYQNDPGDKQFFIIDRHFNSNGHKLVAGQVADFFRSNIIGNDEN